MEGSGDPPRHIAARARFLMQGRTYINQMDGDWGHPEVVRGGVNLGGDQFQVLESLM